jgi:hypothetical protein
MASFLVVPSFAAISSEKANNTMTGDAAIRRIIIGIKISSVFSKFPPNICFFVINADIKLR